MRQAGQETGKLPESGAGAAGLSQALPKAKPNRSRRGTPGFLRNFPVDDHGWMTKLITTALHSPRTRIVAHIEFAWRLADRVTCATAEKVVDACGQMRFFANPNTNFCDK